MRRFRSRRTPHWLESRTQLWREVGLSSEIDDRSAHRAQGGVVVLACLMAGVLVLFSHRRSLFPGLGTPVRIATVVALVILGWAMARSLGRGVAPALLGRLEPGTAGTGGFLIRPISVGTVVVVALRIAGVDSGALAVRGVFTTGIVRA